MPLVAYGSSDDSDTDDNEPTCITTNHTNATANQVAVQMQAAVTVQAPTVEPQQLSVPATETGTSERQISDSDEEKEDDDRSSPPTGALLKGMQLPRL